LELVNGSQGETGKVADFACGCDLLDLPGEENPSEDVPSPVYGYTYRIFTTCGVFKSRGEIEVSQRYHSIDAWRRRQDGSLCEAHDQGSNYDRQDQG
jgi:hypothetical protein